MAAATARRGGETARLRDDASATRSRLDRDCDGNGDHQRRGDHSKSGHSAARERALSVSSSAARKAFTVL